MIVRFLDEAEADVERISLRYDRRELGLGVVFESELHELLARVGSGPETFPTHALQTRRAVLQRFHHVVFYVIEFDHVLVTGVFDGRRHPRSWSDRVREGRDVRRLVTSSGELA